LALSIEAFRSEVQNGPRCTFGKLLERLDPKDRAVLEAALQDPDVKHTRIAEVLAGAGHKMKSHTVSRHRKGECAC
jgi:hypothetical protein